MSTTNETTDKPPGEMLKEARQKLGLSLADVAAMTRIPKAMLEHLESDRYDEYAAEVFARGHLRNYAREVQVDPELVLQAFDRYTGTFESTPELDAAETEETQGTESDDGDGFRAEVWLDWDLEELRSSVRPAHLVAVGLIVVGLFVLFGVFTEEEATATKTYEYEQTSGAAVDSVPSPEKTQESRWLINQNEEDEGSSESSD